MDQSCTKNGGMSDRERVCICIDAMQLWQQDVKCSFHQRAHGNGHGLNESGCSRRGSVQPVAYI